MDCIFWLGNGTWKSDSWLYMVYYDSWNSVWKAVFQDGKTFFHAIWCQCDRVEYKKFKESFERMIQMLLGIISKVINT